MTTETLDFVKRDIKEYEVFDIHCKDNRVKVGEVFQDVDGYHKFWPNHPSGGGYFPTYMMREIADKVDKLNEEWDNIIRNDPRINGTQDN